MCATVNTHTYTHNYTHTYIVTQIENIFFFYLTFSIIIIPRLVLCFSKTFKIRTRLATANTLAFRAATDDVTVVITLSHVYVWVTLSHRVGVIRSNCTIIQIA